MNKISRKEETMELQELEPLRSGQSESAEQGRSRLIVRNRFEAAQLRSRARFWQLRNDQILVAVPNMPDAEAKAWSKKLTDDWRACGCEVGGLFTLVALVGCSIHLWSLDQVGLAEVAAAVGVVFASALVGKLAGLVFAYTRLHQRLKGLERQITNEIAKDRKGRT